MSEQIIVHMPGAATGGVDAQGNPTLGATIDQPVDAIAVAPLTPTEAATAFGDVATVGWTLYLPFGTVIPQDATVTVRGVPGLQQVGVPADWQSPFTGWQPGSVAIVRKLT